MATQSPVIGTLARLRVETGALQRRPLALFGEVASWLDYRLCLFRLYGFHAPVENALRAVDDLPSAIEDANLRNHKVALLALDLVSLGVARRDLAALPRVAVAPLDVPEAIGWMYVVEALTLDGQELARQLAQRLPGEIACASTYLGCYGQEVRARWRAFGASVEAYARAVGPSESDRIVAAAADAFSRLHGWLRLATLQPRADRLHA